MNEKIGYGFIAVLVLVGLGFLVFSNGITGYAIVSNANDAMESIGVSDLSDLLSFNSEDSVLCSDKDGGIDPYNPGFVYDRKTEYGRAKLRRDICTGKRIGVIVDGKKVKKRDSIIEGYCDNEGKARAVKLTTKDLGPGYCDWVRTTVDGIKKSYGIWKSTSSENFCVDKGGGIVLDTEGIHKPHCERGIYITYSCENDALKSTEEDCGLAGDYSRCTKQGCISNSCTDTDDQNDLEISGIVSVTNPDGSTEDYKDTCNSNKNRIKQYKCNSNGKVIPVNKNGKVWVSCGNNKVCVDGADGARCVDIATKEALNNAGKLVLKTKADVSGLNNRVEDLRKAVCFLDGNFSFCDGGTSGYGGIERTPW